MQKPPERRTPTILFTRATSEWIGRVNQKHKQLADLQLSARERDTFDRWTETEFVYSTLQLDDCNVSRDDVVRLVVLPSVSETATGGEDLTIVALLESLRKIKSRVCEGGRSSTLTPDLLRELGGVSGGASGFRTGNGDLTRSPKPISPELLPAAVDSACGWYTAGSFAELHPVEQAAIVLLRLIELQPFDLSSGRAALVAASLFTLRSELPPIIVRPEMRSAYRAALDEGSRMNTKPMVELVAEAIEKSITEMIAQVEEQEKMGR